VSVEALEDEMAACEVVCVNCHRKRTALRGGWRRARSNWRTHGGRARSEERNLVLAYETLARSGCVDCGLPDLCVLDFDHVIPGKTANVLDLARSGCRESRLLEEMSLCAVRCANCHRRRTLEGPGSYRRPTPKL
jgi:hypothetical protein